MQKFIYAFLQNKGFSVKNKKKLKNSKKRVDICRKSVIIGTQMKKRAPKNGEKSQ